MVIWTSCYTSRSTCKTSLIVLLFLTLGMWTLKENNEKEVSEESRPETQSQVCPLAGDERKPLSKNLDIGNLHSWRGKKAKHVLS